MLIEAFKQIINIQGVDFTYYRMSDEQEFTVKVALSNYYRFITGVIEDTTIDRQELVMAVDSIDFVPKRGDRLYNNIQGNLTILDVKKMIVFGQVAGYRLRVE